MRKHLLILTASLILGSALTFTGCKKDDDNNQVTLPSYQLRFTNTSDNPYLVEVDGNSNTLSGHSFRNYTLEKGTYAWKVTQQSGYLFYPTIQNGTVTLIQDKEIIFP